MDYAGASPSKCPETSPIVTTVLKDRRTSSIAIPDNDLSSRIQVADDDDLQYKIYYELTKITTCLNAVTKRPATEAGPSVTRRRSCGILASHHVAARDSDNKMPTLETAEYDAFGQQFTTLVIISTFTANLIIGFLTLAHNTISAMPSVRIVQNEVGMFFALGGMAIHSGVIVVAGRCAALAFKYAKRVPVHSSDEIQKEMQQGRQQRRSGPGSRSPTNELAEDAREAPQQNEEVQKVQDQINQPSATITTENSSPDFVTCIPQLFHSRTYKGTAVPATPCSPVSSVAPIEASQALHLSDFHRFLRVCETLQLLGTAIFFLGVMILIFMMFFHRVFPIMLLVSCVCGTCLISWIIKFWQISVTKQLIRLARRGLMWLLEGISTMLGMRGRENDKVGGTKGKRARRWSKAGFLNVRWSDTVDVEKCEEEHDGRV